MRYVGITDKPNMYIIYSDNGTLMAEIEVVYNKILNVVYLSKLKFQVPFSDTCYSIINQFIEELFLFYKAKSIKYISDGYMDSFLRHIGGIDNDNGFIEIRRRKVKSQKNTICNKTKLQFKKFSGTMLDLKKFVEAHYMDVDSEAYIVSSTYYIMLNNAVVGLISYTLQSNKAPYSLYIDCVEILDDYRRQGLGIEVLKLLFENSSKHPIYQNIYGESRPDAFKFWKAVGANFQMSDKKLAEYYEDGYSACFVLNRRKFLSVIANK